MALLHSALVLLAVAQSLPADLIIKNGTVVTMDRELRVLPGGALVIRGNRISAVHAAGESLPPARETLDASGQLVIPGLINTHGHIPMVLFRGIAEGVGLMRWLNEIIFPAEAKNVSSDFSYWGTLLGSIAMVKSGTTTFVDGYYYEDDVARAVDRVGLRGILGQAVIGFPAADFKTPEAALLGAEVFIKKWRGHPRIIPSVAPHALYTTSLDIVKKARELSRRYDIPFQIHANESPQEDEAVRAKLGQAAIAALDEAGVLGPGVILHHVCTVTPQDIGRLRARGVGTSHNPKSTMRGGSRLAPVPDILKADVPMGLGTDGAASNSTLDMFEEMDLATKVHKLVREDPSVMPAREVVKMATIGGARALGLADRIGSLEAGKRADVVLIDVSAPELQPLYDVYSHLAFAVRGPAVRTVIVDGRIILRERRMTLIDEREVAAHASELQQRILKSLGTAVR